VSGASLVAAAFVTGITALVMSFQDVIGGPNETAASSFFSLVFLFAVGKAFVHVRRREIAQHREWMIRSYPFAMVFVFARAILAIPAVKALGEVGFVSVVWSLIAAACFVPSLVISWRALFGQAPARARAAVAPKAARAAV
jgi:hypothetical protein